MNSNHTKVLLAVFFLVVGVHQIWGQDPDAIYFNGSIHTMIRDGHQVEALAVRNGDISAAGAKADVMAKKGDDTRLVDLKGRALLPGFVDPHSHVIQQALKFSVVNLDPHPIGDIKTIADIQRKLKERIEERQPAPGQWVFGWGYDDTGVEEKRHLLATTLMLCPPNIPFCSCTSVVT